MLKQLLVAFADDAAAFAAAAATTVLTYLPLCYIEFNARFPYLRPVSTGNISSGATVRPFH
jgi:hypothetical protein